MSGGSIVLDEKSQWIQNVLGLRLTASEVGLSNRFDSLELDESDRLKIIRDALPKAADLIATRKLGPRLGKTAERLSSKAGGKLPAKGIPDPMAPRYALELGYDIAEALQGNFLDSVPLGTFRDVVLSDTELARKWQDSFVEWVDEQDRIIGQIADQRLARMESAADMAAGTIDGAERSGYAGAAELGGAMTEVLEKCPTVSQHLAAILSGKGATVIRFSDTAKDAFFSKKGDLSAGVPDNCITLAKTKPAGDMLDALIFESCNAEFQKDFDALNKDLTAPLQNNATAPALGALEYGRKKLAIEAKTILKDAQLKFAMLSDGATVANQGKRNMFALYKGAMDARGTPIGDADAIMDNPARLTEFVDKNHHDIGAFLSAADSDPAIFEAMLDTMAATPHKANAAPDDTQGLKTGELYAYEMLENTSAQLIANMVLKEIHKAAPIPKEKIAPLRKVVMDWLRVYDVTIEDKRNSAGRLGIIETIVEQVRLLLPNADFEAFAMTGDMKKMAKARGDGLRSGNVEAFKEGDRKQAEAIEELKKLLAT